MAQWSDSCSDQDNAFVQKCLDSQWIVNKSLVAMKYHLICENMRFCEIETPEPLRADLQHNVYMSIRIMTMGLGSWPPRKSCALRRNERGNALPPGTIFWDSRIEGT